MGWFYTPCQNDSKSHAWLEWFSLLTWYSLSASWQYPISLAVNTLDISFLSFCGLSLSHIIARVWPLWPFNCCQGTKQRPCNSYCKSPFPESGPWLWASIKRSSAPDIFSKDVLCSNSAGASAHEDHTKLCSNVEHIFSAGSWISDISKGANPHS